MEHKERERLQGRKASDYSDGKLAMIEQTKVPNTRKKMSERWWKKGRVGHKNCFWKKSPLGFQDVRVIKERRYGRKRKIPTTFRILFRSPLWRSMLHFPSNQVEVGNPERKIPEPTIWAFPAVSSKVLIFFFFHVPSLWWAIPSKPSIWYLFKRQAFVVRCLHEHSVPPPVHIYRAVLWELQREKNED